MGRFLIMDRHFNPDRVHVSRLEEDGVYLIGFGGAGFSDVTREEWEQLNANVVAGFDSADEHRAVTKKMGVARRRKATRGVA